MRLSQCDYHDEIKSCLSVWLKNENNGAAILFSEIQALDLPRAADMYIGKLLCAEKQPFCAVIKRLRGRGSDNRDGS